MSGETTSSSLSDQLAVVKAEFASMQDEMQTRLALLTVSMKEIEDAAERKLKEVEEAEQRLAALEAKMEEGAKKAADIIKLNVGGTKFAISRSTLLQHQSSYFYVMMASGRWKPNDGGHYFIDRSPELFPVILHYLREGELRTENFQYDITEPLKKELDYYMLDIPELNRRFESTVMDQAYGEQVFACIGKTRSTLLYRASRDGWTAAAFNSKCDNQGPTVIAVRLANNSSVVAGYVTNSWAVANGWVGSAQRVGAYVESFSLSLLTDQSHPSPFGNYQVFPAVPIPTAPIPVLPFPAQASPTRAPRSPTRGLTMTSATASFQFYSRNDMRSHRARVINDRSGMFAQMQGDGGYLIFQGGNYTLQELEVFSVA